MRSLMQHASAACNATTAPALRSLLKKQPDAGPAPLEDDCLAGKSCRSLRSPLTHRFPSCYIRRPATCITTRRPLPAPRRAPHRPHHSQSPHRRTAVRRRTARTTIRRLAVDALPRLNVSPRAPPLHARLTAVFVCYVRSAGHHSQLRPA